MAWNGTGTYSRIHNWVADAAVPIDITASRMDAEDDSIAAGINNCIAKDGQNSATANLPMGNHKHTGVAASVDRTDYARVAELQDNAHNYVASDTGAADAYAIAPGPAIAAYADGQVFVFPPGNNNTGASTLAVSGLAATDIKTIDGNDPVADDIVAAKLCVVQYDGTNFVLHNPATWAPGGTQVLSSKTITDAVLNTSVSGTAVLDEDDLASDSDTQIATQQSIKAYITNQLAGNRIVHFNDMQNLVTITSTTSLPWATFDMSAAGGDAAAAASAGATAAILSLSSRHSQNGGVSASNVILLVAEGGTGAGGITNPQKAHSEAGNSDGDFAHDVCLAIVPLDGNGDFDYATIVDDASTVACNIYLAGYFY